MTFWRARGANAAPFDAPTSSSVIKTIANARPYSFMDAFGIDIHHAGIATCRNRASHFGGASSRKMLHVTRDVVERFSGRDGELPFFGNARLEMGGF